MSEKYIATGVIEAISPTKVISDKFSVREFVLQTDIETEYPQFCKFQCAGKNVPKLDGFEKGSVVNVSFSLRGREYTSKKTGVVDYFTSLDAWKIEAVAGAPARQDSPPPVAPDPNEDIPF